MENFNRKSTGHFQGCNISFLNAIRSKQYFVLFQSSFVTKGSLHLYLKIWWLIKNFRFSTICLDSLNPSFDQSNLQRIN